MQTSQLEADENSRKEETQRPRVIKTQKRTEEDEAGHDSDPAQCTVDAGKVEL